MTLERAMSSQRTHLTVVAAMLLAGSTVLAPAQTTGGPAGGAGSPPAADQSTSRPSAQDTTGMGGARPGCAPSADGPPAERTAKPPDAMPGDVRTPRIINDPTVGTSQTAETDPISNPLIPKDPKTGSTKDC
jgi:hypothetical protein